MKLLIPNSVRSAMHYTPPAPTPEDANGGATALTVAMIILTLIISLGGGFLPMLAIDAIVLGIAWSLASGNAEKVEARNKQRLLAYQDADHSSVIAQNFKSTVARLSRTDFAGEFTPLTPKGPTETTLQNALVRAGFRVERTPETMPCIVPQYELLELGWPTWESGHYGYKNYVADFAYLDPDKGIKIDIEIDESYHDDDGGARDAKRNDNFLNRDWVVIRFKDHEVRDNPNGCAREVKAVIDALENAQLDKLTKLLTIGEARHAV